MSDGFGDELVRSVWDLVQALFVILVVLSPLLVVAAPVALYVMRRSES